MAPSAAFKSREAEKERVYRLRMATEQYAQATHLVEGFADTLDALPPALTRSLSDLKELDAVLTTPLLSIKAQLDKLVESLANPDSMRPRDRLRLLREVVDEMVRYKVGGDDKIRVANGACETLQTHIRQLDVTTSLLIASLPPALESRIPPSTLPGGYPRLTGALRSKPSGGVWGDGRGFAGGSSSVTSPLIGSSMAVVGEPYPPPPAPPIPQMSVPIGVPIAHAGMPLDQAAAGRGRGAGATAARAAASQYMGHGIGPGGFAYALGPDGLITDRKIHHNQHTKKRAREAEAAAAAAAAVSGPDTFSQQYPPPPGPQAYGMNPPPQSLGGPIGAVQKNAKRPRPSMQDDGAPRPGDSDGNARGTLKKRVKRMNEGEGGGYLQPGQPATATAYAGVGLGSHSRRRSPNSASGSPAVAHTVPGQNPGSHAHPHHHHPAGASTNGNHFGTNGAHLSSLQPHRTVSGRQVNPPVRPGEELDGVPAWAVSGPGARYDTNGTSSRNGSLNGGVRRAPNPAKSRKSTISTQDDGGETESSMIGGNPGEPRPRARRPRRGIDITGEEGDADAEEGADAPEYGDEIDGDGEANNSRIYCICQGAGSNDEQMVGCDNKECPFEWFHLTCVGLDEVPEGSWYCSECVKAGYAPGNPNHRRNS